MKHEIYLQYVERICSIFRITKEELFSKTKKRYISDARQLLMYVCYIRPMNIVFIEGCLKESGFEVGHSTVIHAIKSTKKRIQSDPDYTKMILKVTK